jgi:hypothetical protein
MLPASSTAAIPPRGIWPSTSPFGPSFAVEEMPSPTSTWSPSIGVTEYLPSRENAGAVMPLERTLHTDSEPAVPSTIAASVSRLVTVPCDGRNA